jgi:hypothetical protein
MTKLLAGSALFLCLASTFAAGCSSDNKPNTSGTGGAGTGGAGNAGGLVSAGDTSTGGVQAGTTTDTGPQDTEVRTVAPNDLEHLTYSGRIDFSDPTKPIYSAPGVVISARFNGVSVAVRLKDAFTGMNFFEVVIDRDPAKTYVFEPNTLRDKIDVVSDLPYGEHLVEFVKRTEASQGQVTFLGFELGGALLPAPAKPDRRIEIIGDSISCGSGDEPGQNQVTCETNENLAENAYLSYGAVLARALSAEYHITAAGGRGAMRNYECNRNDTLPAVYDHLHINDLNSPLWDHTQFVPHAIILALGTNDFSPDQCNQPPLSPACDPTHFAAFVAAMEQFITKLHGYYPEAQILMTSSPMLTDGWPDPVVVGDAGVACPYTSRTSHLEALRSILAEMQAASGGASYLHLVDTIPKYQGRGCGTHPNTTEHAKIGGGDPAQLLNPVKQVMGW